MIPSIGPGFFPGGAATEAWGRSESDAGNVIASLPEKLAFPKSRLGKSFAAADSGVPRFNNGVHVGRPRHQDGIATLDDHDRMRIGRRHTANQLVLSIGQG